MMEIAPIAPAKSAGAQRWAVLPFLEIAALVVALALPLVLQDYLTIFATRVLILAIFALSFDLVWGYAGIMSFGQALFFGAGGYGVALLARDLDIVSMLLVLPAGIVIGLVFALFVGASLAFTFSEKVSVIIDSSLSAQQASASSRNLVLVLVAAYAILTWLFLLGGWWYVTPH